VTQFIANSGFVRDRIRRFYDRDAVVVHPFVDDSFLAAPLRDDREPYHVIVSALVPYKRIDLALATGAPLVVIGDGPLRAELSSRAAPNVRFLGRVSREAVIDHVSRAQSLILPGIEDFGITPLEAMALGTPVVTAGEGGVLDSVVPGRTGIFFERGMVDSLRRAIAEAERSEWDRAALRAHAAAFSRSRFRQELAERIRQTTD
jgi:glycosyltransferase involved in cell wall biosynthesis